jgi:hypothetical protein
LDVSVLSGIFVLKDAGKSLTLPKILWHVWLSSSGLFFLIFHSSLTLFNVFGWIWHKTRMANFITLVLTGLSWFGLGLFYGIGFCPLTEWHWHVLKKLGQADLPYSYIKYIIFRLSGINMNARLVEISTVVVFFLAFFISGYLNFFRRRVKKVM